MKKPERQTYFFAIVREHGGQGQPGRSLQLSLFIRLRKYRSEAGCCQDGSARIMSQKCNLKTYNALQPIPDLENHETWAPDTGRLERSFVIIGLRRNPPEWRYRLGVRTEDSQSYSGQPKYMVALIFVCFTFVGIGRLLWQWVNLG